MTAKITFAKKTCNFRGGVVYSACKTYTGLGILLINEMPSGVWVRGRPEPMTCGGLTGKKRNIQKCLYHHFQYAIY